MPILTIDGNTSGYSSLVLDNLILQEAPTANYGTDVTLYLSDKSGSARRALMFFDLSALPDGITITEATLSLYYHNKYGDPTGTEYKFYRCRRSDWAEAQSTWNIYKTGSSWGTAGCSNTATDVDTSVVSAGTVTVPASYGWVDWNVLSLVQDAYANRSKLLHLLLRSPSETNATTEYFDVASSEYGTVGYRPKLVITYTSKPVVDTNDATSVLSYSATLSGDAVDDGGFTLDDYGFIWDTVAISDPGNVAPNSWTPTGSGHGEGHWEADTGTTEGTDFTHGISGLSARTTYYARAAAHNEAGWAYGDQIEFTTNATHRISNANTAGVKKGGLPLEGAVVGIYDMITGLTVLETTDADGKWSHDEYVLDEAQPRFVCFCVHDDKATLQTAQGSNKDLIFMAKATDADHWYPGAAGNSLTVAYVHTGSLSVSVDGSDITVNIDAGTTTAAQIKAAIEADPDANKMVAVACPSGQDGSGTPAALTKTNLANGAYYTSTTHAFITPSEIT